MNDQRSRPRGAAGSISAPGEDDSSQEPQQLVLWSAARHDADEKNGPGREASQVAPSKFLLIEPIVSGANAAPSRDREIRADDEVRPPRRDEFTIPELAAPAPWVQLAILSGVLAIGLCLGWIGGSMSSRLFASAPAPAPVQHADGSACAREGGCAAAKSDREPAPSPPAAKVAGPRARIVERTRDVSRATQQASAGANRDVATTSSISATRPTAVPETRPTTIEGWAIREVLGGAVVLEGPGGVWRVRQGDTVPGVGRIDSIVRWGSRWIVATSRGLISTLD
jgi:hypothetical protein